MTRLIATLAFAAFTAAPATAAEPSAQRFQLEAEIRDGDGAPTRPRLIMAAGQPATIQIANERYSLRLTATPDAEAKVAIGSLVTSWTSSGLVHQDRQAELRAGGAPVQLRFPRTDPVSGSNRELTIDIRVTPAAQ